MDAVRLKRLLFTRFKAWHLYASAFFLLLVICLLVIISPTSLDAGNDVYRKHIVSGSDIVVETRNSPGEHQPRPNLWRHVKRVGEESYSHVPINNNESNKKNNNNNNNNINQNNDNKYDKRATAPGGGDRSVGSTDLQYKKFLEKPILNHHDFPYLINQPGKCHGQTVHLIITTPSAPANFFRRMKSRQAQERKAGAFSIRHLFFLGATNDSGIQAKVEAEAEWYQDIVQEDYLDVYKNITFKAVQMLKWVSEFCPNSSYVLRLDDDVMANVATLLGTMAKAHKKYPEFVMGTVKRGWPPCRIPKCRTTKEEYAAATLPPFALGGALGYPTSSVRRLYEATKRLKMFKLDDVYVTGMCAPLVHVSLVEDSNFSFRHHAW